MSRRRETLGPLTYLLTLSVLAESWTVKWVPPATIAERVECRLDRIRALLGLPFMEGV